MIQKSQNIFDLVNEQIKELQPKAIKQIIRKLSLDKSLTAEEARNLGVFVVSFVSYKFFTQTNVTAQMFRDVNEHITKQLEGTSFTFEDVSKLLNELFTKVLKEKSSRLTLIEESLNSIQKSYEEDIVLHDKDELIHLLLSDQIMFKLNQIKNVDNFVNKNHRYTAEDLIKIFNFILEQSHQPYPGLQSLNKLNTQKVYIDAYKKATDTFQICKFLILFNEYIITLFEKSKHIQEKYNIDKLILSEDEINHNKFDDEIVEESQEDSQVESVETESQEETDEAKADESISIKDPDYVLLKVIEENGGDLRKFIETLITKDELDTLNGVLQYLENYKSIGNTIKQDVRTKITNELNEITKHYGEIYKKNVELVLSPFDEELQKRIYETILSLCETIMVSDTKLKEVIMMLQDDSELIVAWNQLFEVVGLIENQYSVYEKEVVERYNALEQIINEKFIDKKYNEIIQESVDAESIISIAHRLNTFVNR